MRLSIIHRLILLVLAVFASPSAYAAMTLGGYSTTNVSAARGGSMEMLVVTDQPRNHQVFFEGIPTGFVLRDDGTGEDIVAGDGVAVGDLLFDPFNAGTVQIPVLLEVPSAGNWPYLKVAPGTVSTATPTPSPTPVPTLTPTPTYDFSEVTRILDQNIDDFDGNVVVVVKRGGQELYRYTAGFDLNSVVGLASATKWLSGAIVLDTIEQTSMGIDDWIGDWVPELEAAGKGDWTIRQGFAMSSGMFYPQSATQNPLTPEINPFMTHLRSVQDIADTCPLVFASGQGLAYDGAQMQAVGLACVNATGANSWRDLADKRLFQRLGLTSGTYDRFGLNPAVAGGAEMHARDYLTFLQMLMDGGMHRGQPILSQASIDSIFTNQTPNVPVYASPFPTGPFYPYGERSPSYAFGCWVQAENPLTGMVEELNSPGANGTFPWVDRKRNIYGIILTFVPSLGQVLQTEFQVLDAVRSAIDRGIPTPRPQVTFTPTPTAAPTFTPVP